MVSKLAASDGFCKRQSDAARGGFGAGCFLAAASAGAAVEAGRGDGNGAIASGDDEAGGRDADGATGPGSGVMMLIGGVEAAVGNSALVGLPVATDGARVATGPAAAGGAFHDGA